jgi:hypothetical protein
MLWKAYSKRREVPSMDESSEEFAGMDGNAQEVEMASSPPPYVEDETKSVESIIDERLLHEV